MGLTMFAIVKMHQYIGVHVPQKTDKMMETEEVRYASCACVSVCMYAISQS